MKETIDFESLSEKEQKELLTLNDQASKELAEKRIAEAKKDSTPRMMYAGQEATSSRDIEKIDEDWWENKKTG